MNWRPVASEVPLWLNGQNSALWSKVSKEKEGTQTGTLDTEASSALGRGPVDDVLAKGGANPDSINKSCQGVADSSYRCCVISLAREPQKRIDFLRRNGETGLHFEMFDATDGRTFTFDEFVRNGTVKAGAVRYTLGGLGCAASHRALWTEAARTQRNLLIFEDDVHCRHDVGHQIEKLFSTLREWDVVLLGYNTDAVMDFRISEHCNLAGFFSNETPSAQQLEAFAKETADPALVHLNNTFGLCSYLVSPAGARKLLSLFPLDNRPVRIPGNKTRYGKEEFHCSTVDMIANTFYARMNAYVTIPPLALPLNDRATSTTMQDTSSQNGARAARNSAAATVAFVQRSRRIAGRRFGHEAYGRAVKALAKSITGRFGYELRKIPPPPSLAIANFINSPEALFEPDFGVAGPSKVYTERNASRDSAQKTHSLVVEGWRLLPHSYAIVNQWQLLSLSRRPDVALKVIDAPPYVQRWQPQEGMFEANSEQILKSIEHAGPDENADLMLRISYPLDFAPSRSRRTAVFGTSEHQTIRKDQCRDYRTFQQFQERLGPLSEVRAVTPSRWSAEGFYNSGFKTDQVVVVPHGVDIETFHPMPDLRSHIREKLFIAESEFVFLSVGAITPNKGIDLLLRAFAEVSQKFPQARLVLKGLNPLHRSKEHLLKIIQKLPPRDQESVVSKMKYFGNPFSNREMALLYQVADIYVSPYRAEGFNIPVLEAAACGIPILCTGGGATDDFVADTFARKIESSRQSNCVEGQEFVWLEPDLEHLIALMTAAIEDKDWSTLAAKAGPLHVRASYSWDRVVATLLQELLH